MSGGLFIFPHIKEGKCYDVCYIKEATLTDGLIATIVEDRPSNYLFDCYYSMV